MGALLHSRKFWMAVFDAVVTTIGLVVGVFAPEQREFILALVGLWQIPVSLVIIGVTVEDAALKRNPLYLEPIAKDK